MPVTPRQSSFEEQGPKSFLDLDHIQRIFCYSPVMLSPSIIRYPPNLEDLLVDLFKREPRRTHSNVDIMPDIWPPRARQINPGQA